jgi:LPS export ABC transporter protein LptC
LTVADIKSRSWGNIRLNKKIKIIIVALIVFVLIGVAVFAVVKVIGKKKANILKILPDEADLRIQDFVYTDVGQDNIRWEVKAKSAQYQKKQNLALLDQVQTKLTTQEGKVFIMTGDEGRMLTDKKDVEIKGHVVIISDTGDKLSTDYLRYSEAEKKIYTDAPVTMESKRMKIQGVGLVIFMNSGEITFSSRVKAKIN